MAFSRKKIQKKENYVITRCEKCGNLVPHGQYCTACGAELPHTTASKLTMTCTFCGGTSPEGTYCSRCGSRQREQEPAKPISAKQAVTLKDFTDNEIHLWSIRHQKRIFEDTEEKVVWSLLCDRWQNRLLSFNEIVVVATGTRQNNRNFTGAPPFHLVANTIRKDMWELEQTNWDRLVNIYGQLFDTYNKLCVHCNNLREMCGDPLSEDFDSDASNAGLYLEAIGKCFSVKSELNIATEKYIKILKTQKGEFITGIQKLKRRK